MPAGVEPAGSSERGRPWTVLLAAVIVPIALVIVYAAFHAGTPSRAAGTSTTVSTPARATGSSAPSTTKASAAPTTTLPATTVPTTAASGGVPPAPQPTADQAANALISSWASGNRPRAMSVATSEVVAVLFATPYQSGMAIDRGCNSQSPATCAFGPPGGASPSDPLYQLTVTQVPGGWYVSAMQIQSS